MSTSKIFLAFFIISTHFSTLNAQTLSNPVVSAGILCRHGQNLSINMSINNPNTKNQNVFIETTPEISLFKVEIKTNNRLSTIYLNKNSIYNNQGRLTDLGTSPKKTYKTKYYGFPFPSGNSNFILYFSYNQANTNRDAVGINFGFSSPPPGNVKFAHIKRDLSAGCLPK